ncbi:MAG: M48 family metallopeptidase [Nanoarchaeota archaeon]|nr:M48 family metallopeptidase [Nanoarchaeota archaeon]
MLYNEISSNKTKSVLLFILFLILVGVIVFVVNMLFFQGYVFIIFAALIAIIFSLISYYSGDKIVLAMTKAKEAKKKDYPFLINLVEGLTLAAGIPKPKVYVIPGAQINAFAVGTKPEKASIAVTEGALQKLDRQELEGVIAHEMSHIKNFDIRVMMLASVLVGIIVFASEIMLRSFIFGGLRSRESKGGSAQIILIVVGIALLILAPIIAQMIKFAISRKREFLADASGALITRNPKGLANALKKIKSDVSELKVASRSNAHLYISSPFKKKQWLAGMFSTHPDVNERIRRLESM